MLCRCGWLVGYMFCHLCCVVDLCTLDVVVSFSRSSCMVVARVVGSSESSTQLFLLFLFVVEVIRHLLCVA
jgi:hypothetical protein